MGFSRESPLSGQVARYVAGCRAGFLGTGQNASFCIRGVVGEVPLDEVQNIEAFVIPEKFTEGAERGCHGPATAEDRQFRS